MAALVTVVLEAADVGFDAAAFEVAVVRAMVPTPTPGREPVVEVEVLFVEAPIATKESLVMFDRANLGEGGEGGEERTLV